MHLAIEIDGDSRFVNQDVLEYDKERQNYIEKLGIVVTSPYKADVVKSAQ